MIRKILVGLDSTPYTDSAVRHAVELSKTCGAELTGVALIHSSKADMLVMGNSKAKPLIARLFPDVCEYMIKCAGRALFLSQS